MKIIKTLLVYIGKELPYFLLLILLLENIESMVAFSNNYWGLIGETEVLYTPISWKYLSFVNYGWIEVFTLLILSIATRCCWRNRLAIAFLAINLLEKGIIEKIIVDTNDIPIYLTLNIVVIFIILVLGIFQWIKPKKRYLYE